MGVAAADVLERVAAVYEEHRDPERAGPMARYMKDQFPFLGIPTPARRALDRAVLAGLPPPTEHELARIARAAWKRPEREYQYFATDFVVRHASVCSPAFLDVLHELITRKSWWDTVDALATAVGILVRNHPELGADMDAWIEDDDCWIVRSALLHQNRFKADTDRERLFRYCERQAANREFFVRKGIGWALREYSKTDASAVRRFVAGAGELSGLSRREALKWLERQEARGG